MADASVSGALPHSCAAIACVLHCYLTLHCAQTKFIRAAISPDHTPTFRRGSPPNTSKCGADWQTKHFPNAPWLYPPNPSLKSGSVAVEDYCKRKVFLWRPELFWRDKLPNVR